MTLRTKLTELLGIRHSVLLAPMGGTAGGRLAAAVSDAGGLGQIGGGRNNAEWLEREFAAAGNQRVDCGFITWGLAKRPEPLDRAQTHAGSRSCSLSGMPGHFSRRSNRRAFRRSARSSRWPRHARCSNRAPTLSSHKLAKRVDAVRPGHIAAGPGDRGHGCGFRA
jgi:Nitronate monooxygenase